jgi:nitroreductase
MELSDVLARRAMMRSFSAEPLPAESVDAVVAAALRAPSAGNTRGVSWVVLEGAETSRYWDAVTTALWRERSARWPGLSRAPVILVALASPDAYLARYGETDKETSGLGAGTDAWPVPYWFADAAFAVMAALLAAVDGGLGAAFLGNFRGEEELLAALCVPEGWRWFGAVLLGHPDGKDNRSASLRRAAPTGAERVHRGRWGAQA